MVLLERIRLFSQSHNYDDPTSRFLKTFALCLICILKQHQNNFKWQVFKFYVTTDSNWLLFLPRQHAYISCRNWFVSSLDLITIRLHHNYIYQVRRSIWCNNNTAKSDLQGLPHSLITLLPGTFMMWTHNWNCEIHLNQHIT